MRQWNICTQTPCRLWQVRHCLHTRPTDDKILYEWNICTQTPCRLWQVRHCLHTRPTDNKILVVELDFESLELNPLMCPSSPVDNIPTHHPLAGTDRLQIRCLCLYTLKYTLMCPWSPVDSMPTYHPLAAADRLKNCVYCLYTLLCLSFNEDTIPSHHPLAAADWLYIQCLQHIKLWHSEI